MLSGLPPPTSGSGSGGVTTHEDVAPQVIKPARNPGASVLTAILCAAVFCWVKALGDESSLPGLPRHLLAALRVLPNILLALATPRATRQNPYAAATTWGLLLCAAGDALIELDPVFSPSLGGRRFSLLSGGLFLFVAAHAAYALAIVRDLPSSARGIVASLWGPALAVLAYRALQCTFLLPQSLEPFKGITGFSVELLGVVNPKRFRMIVYTLSTSSLLVLALGRRFAGSQTTTTTTTATKNDMATKNWAVAGCLFFVASDTVLTYARQVGAFPYSEGAFLALYYLGQVCIAMSIPPASGADAKGQGASIGGRVAQEETKQAEAVGVTQIRRKSRKVE